MYRDLVAVMNCQQPLTPPNLSRPADELASQSPQAWEGLEGAICLIFRLGNYTFIPSVFLESYCIFGYEKTAGVPAVLRLCGEPVL